MDDRQLIADLLSALEYHTEQTRPIEFSKVAIEAAREYLQKPAQRKPLPKGEWPKHPSPYVNDEYRGYLKSDLDDYAMQVLAAHNIKENT